jgi:chromatin segregation and condensation protein Rec8/ScpA/Scc1 (kleisin family)
VTQLQQVLDLGYEVKLPVFEGPLDLLLYLVEKNELNPRDVSIATITDQYLEHLAALTKTDLGEAGEFLVMASRLMRLKARELLPADDKDPLEEMEYLLDRQALIAQMLEYRKFKEAARSLRDIEAKNFGAFPRGRSEKPSAAALAALFAQQAAQPGDMPAEIPEEIAYEEDENGESEAGIYDLLAAFKSVLAVRPRIPVHEVEIDEVTIEDRMQHVETELVSAGRILFEDLFGNDPRRMAKVVTFMALLELCKLDRIVVRQNRALGTIWVYRKDTGLEGNKTAGAAQDARAEAMAQAIAQELAAADAQGEPEISEIEVKPGLVAWVQEQILQRKSRSALDQILSDLERELKEEDDLAASEAANADAEAGADANSTATSTSTATSETGESPETTKTIEGLEGSISPADLPEIESLAAATLESGAPDVPERALDAVGEDADMDDET